MQGQFCFQEAKFASDIWQKHFVFPRGMEAWQNGETVMETCFLVLPGPYSFHYTKFLQLSLTQKFDATKKESTVCGPSSVRSLVRDFFEYDLIFP